MKTIASSNPLQRAKWLWPEGNLYLQNCHAQFRHDFELKQVPEQAPLFITADQWYRLYVNGRYVCRGPARGYQAHWPCDEVDIHEFLQPGHNFLAVEGFNPGVGTFQYLHCDAAGMICAAEWGETLIHSNKATWQMRRSPANNPNVARLSFQMGFQEDFDANADDLSWIYSPTPPAWQEAKMFRWAGEILFGKAPWHTLEERGIPLLRENLLAPKAITSHGVGTMSAGYEKCFNIAWQWQGDERATVKEWLPGDTINARRSSEGLAFEVDPLANNTFHAITLSMDEIQIGTFEVDVTGGVGGEIVDCLYYQYLQDGIPQNLLPIGNGGMLALATRLRVAPGHCSRMFFTPQGAKFIVLVFRGVTQTLKVKTAWRTMEYPFAMGGGFETSDPVLNDIHHICRQTQQICSADAYLDTPWREQGQWWGDARVQAKNTFYLDGDSRLLRRGIYSIAGQETGTGLTFGVAPCCNGGCVLPDFSLTWVLTIFDYYWQTGELDVFFDHQERVKRVFAYFESPEAQGANGLLKFDKRFWLFEDWAPLFKDGYPTFLNLWHLYVLRRYEALLRAANLEVEAEKVKATIAKREVLLSAAFFDEAQGLFVGGRTWDDAPAATPPSLHDQALAVLTGLKPERHKDMAEKRLLPFLRGKTTDYAVPTSFWCTYLFDAATQLGLRREVLDFIRTNWGKMIYCGGTWEHFVWNQEDGQSCCHAWSAHPASHLVNLLVGLNQTDVAWNEVEWTPLLREGVEHAAATIVTPQGMLKASWRRNGAAIDAHIEIPQGMEVVARLPGTPVATLASGAHDFKI